MAGWAFMSAAVEGKTPTGSAASAEGATAASLLDSVATGWATADVDSATAEVGAATADVGSAAAVACPKMACRTWTTSRKTWSGGGTALIL